MLRQEERRKHENVFALFPSFSQSGYRDQETITHVTFRHGGVCLLMLGRFKVIGGGAVRTPKLKRIPEIPFPRTSILNNFRGWMTPDPPKERGSYIELPSLKSYVHPSVYYF